MEQAQPRQFSIRGVILTGLEVFFQNFFPFMALSLIVWFPIFLFEYNWTAWFGLGSGRTYLFLGMAIDIFFYGLLIGALSYGIFRYLSNPPVSFFACLGNGIGLVLRVIAISIVVMLVQVISFWVFCLPGLWIWDSDPTAGLSGFAREMALLRARELGIDLGPSGVARALAILLIGAGVIVSTVVGMMLWVAVPVAAIENTGTADSMGRSRRLTKGHRWPIFGFLLLFFLVEFVFYVIMQLVLTPRLPISMADFVPLLLARWMVGAFFGAVTAVIVCVGYQRLRMAKEDTDIGSMAAALDARDRFAG